MDVQLCALDALLKDELRIVYGGEYKFEKFVVSVRQQLPRNLKVYDCGLYIIRYIENQDTYMDFDYKVVHYNCPSCWL